MTYLEFKKKYNGKTIDYDGSYGGQCWDCAQYYFTECLKLSPDILGGVGLVSNMLKEPKLSLLLKYFDEVPQNSMNAGDVIIWYYGHIAIFDYYDAKTNLCYFFSQNPNPCQVISINNWDFKAFRIKGPSSEDQIKELNKQIVSLNDNIALKGKTIEALTKEIATIKTYLNGCISNEVAEKYKDTINTLTAQISVKDLEIVAYNTKLVEREELVELQNKTIRNLTTSSSNKDNEIIKLKQDAIILEEKLSNQNYKYLFWGLYYKVKGE